VVSSVIIAAQNPLGPARLIDYVERLSNVVFLMRADPAKAKSPDANPLAAAARLSACRQVVRARSRVNEADLAKPSYFGDGEAFGANGRILFAGPCRPGVERGLVSSSSTS